MNKTNIYFLLAMLTLTSWNDDNQKQKKSNQMTTTDFTTTILVDQTPEQAFNAINNVRGWWSEEIEGPTDKLNETFKYHYEDVHRCQIKIVELVAAKKVVWLVQDNYFQFTKDKSEWKGTKIIFDITEKDNKTQIRFTHQGLVPEYECFEVCRDAWTTYIQNSLCSLITTGKGKPNATGKPQTEDEKNKSWGKQDYTVSITVDATAKEAFNSINSVTKWWTENLEGHSQKLDDEFTVRFGDVHVSTQKLIEIIPDKKVVWLVTDSKLNFIKDKSEWTGTKISFEITEKDNKTQIRFTHLGLAPGIECFDACSNAWGDYITNSLRKLVNTGKGQPTPKEVKTTAAKN